MIIKIILIILTFAWPARLLPAEETIPITILYTAGNKGYFLPYKIYENRIFKDLDIKVGDRYGGYAAIAHYIEKTRKEVEKEKGIFLLLDGGNSLVGSSEANFFRGRVSVDFMNRMGYNSITVSNLDWSLGTDNVRELSGNAEFAFLNANILIEGTDKHPLYLKPYLIIAAGGLKIGIIGYVQHEFPRWLDPYRIKGLEGRPAIPIVRKYIEEMRDKGADLIIAMDHTARDNHLDTASQTEGIDVLIDGAGGTVIMSGRPSFPGPRKEKIPISSPRWTATLPSGGSILFMTGKNSGLLRLILKDIS